jgi:tripartite-type tricarboxylate transporter receptor subunit TctC
VVTRLNAEVARSLASAEVRDQFVKLGMEAINLSPEAFAKYVRSEIAINQRIVADGKIERQ